MKNIFTLSLMLLTLSGCSSSLLKSFVQTPQLKDVRLNSFSASDKQASFDVDIYNPNLFDIPVTTLDGDIKLNQVPVGHIAATNPSNTLKSQETQTITIPIELDTTDFMGIAKSALFQGGIKYQFIGTVGTSIGPIPIIKEGELSAKDLMTSFF